MFSSSIASFGAHQNWLNANAHNVANVNTNKYVPTDTTINENVAKEPQANFSKAMDDGSTRSQTDLTKEMTEQIESQRGFEVNAPVVKTKDDILGTLLNLKA
ncbi:MAG: flagellar basal body rod C-terminal domain-containing protein [Campylobacterales bacterium]